MRGWGRQCCLLAHHTHRLWEVPSMIPECCLLAAKCGFVCLWRIREPAGHTLGSRFTRSTLEKREGSKTVCPVWPREGTGQEKALPPKLSESTPFMSNWRGLTVVWILQNLLLNSCKSYSPGPELQQQLPAKAIMGGQEHLSPSVWPPWPGLVCG